MYKRPSWEDAMDHQLKIERVTRLKKELESDPQKDRSDIEAKIKSLEAAILKREKDLAKKERELKNFLTEKIKNKELQINGLEFKKKTVRKEISILKERLKSIA